MNDEITELYDEMEMVRNKRKSKRLRIYLDKMKYALLLFYLTFFLLVSLYGHEDGIGTHNEDDIVIYLECPYCHENIRAGFFGWTCEYCHGYNPPAVSTCQTCRKPRGY